MRKSTSLTVITIVILLCYASVPALAYSLIETRTKAEKGVSWAQNHLGVLYRNGSGGVVKNELEAVKWFRMAADQGNISAEKHLGMIYLNGRGAIKPDAAEAIKWFSKAAEKGDMYAEYNLGNAYHLAKDDVSAKKWWDIAAERGFPPKKHSKLRKVMCSCVRLLWWKFGRSLCV